MRHILMIFALCSIATAPQADALLTPWAFDLQKQFTSCINTASDTPYKTCQDKLSAAYTLRREIAYALNTCLSGDTAGCINTFNDAGLPAERLNIANLTCTMLAPLTEGDLPYIPEDSCIEHIAQTIVQRSIPTSHNTKISCSINYVECLEIGSLGGKYWKNAVMIQHLDQLQAVFKSADLTNDPTTSHRLYSLLERQHRLQIDLAETACSIQTVMPHRANTRDYETCLGQAYADLWLAQNHDITD